MSVLDEFQSPCAGNMFGKGLHVARVARQHLLEFQSPCAGNMFGKNAFD